MKHGFEHGDLRSVKHRVYCRRHSSEGTESILLLRSLASCAMPPTHALPCAPRCASVAAIPASERIAAATSLVAQLEAIPEFLTDTNVAGYWADRRRAAACRRSSAACARAVRSITCRSSTSRSAFASRRGGPAWTIAPNRFGIPEPADTNASAPRARCDGCRARAAARLRPARPSARLRRRLLRSRVRVPARSRTAVEAAAGRHRLRCCRKSSASSRATGTCRSTTSRPSAS